MIMAALCDEKAALVSSAQVCSSWADAATSLLWQNAYPPSTLVGHMKPDRVQLYAGKVRSLDLSLETPWRGFISGGDFHLLSKIRINGQNHLPQDTSLAHPKVTRATLKALTVPISILCVEEKPRRLTRYPVSLSGHTPAGRT